MPSEHPHGPHVPFDERAALEELERLHHAVEESRRRRKDASAAFDDFVSSFHKEPRRDVETSAPVVASRTLSRMMDVPPLPQSHTAARKPLPRAGVIAGAVVAVAAGAMLTRVWRSSPVERSSAPTSVSTPAPGETVPAAPVAASAAAAGGQRLTGGVPAEITALRRVWVRATADGTRVVERELQPNERVPLRLSQTLVIRAGDAGAIRLTIDGQDRGPLGADGIVVTRTYSAPSPTGR